MIQKEQREDFIRFLERLTIGRASTSDWQTHAVQHYHDGLLESVRRECVRMVLKHDKTGGIQNLPSNVSRELLELSLKLKDGNT
jgi:hypothetical protein